MILVTMKDKNQIEQPTRSSSKEEEIDLGQLFILIGRGFSNFFNFAGNIFITILTRFLSFLLFLRRNFITITIVSLIGVTLGGIYEFNIKTSTYESSMTVEPNFGSALQLYKNIDFYQSLVEQKDTDRLAGSLNISIEEAFSISLFEVKPYVNKNEIILAYKNFISNLDSSTVKLIDFQTFAQKQPVESFRYHIVNIHSKDKFVFSKLSKQIISSIIKKDTYYDKVKSTSLSNLISKKDALALTMSEMDSLKSIYKEVLLAESKKINSGTNIFMSNLKDSDIEVEVFDKYMIMNDQMTNVNTQLTEKNEVINIISSFNPVGLKIKQWYKNGIILGFLGGIIILLLALFLKELNKFLSIFEEKRKLTN